MSCYEFTDGSRSIHTSFRMRRRSAAVRHRAAPCRARAVPDQCGSDAKELEGRYTTV